MTDSSDKSILCLVSHYLVQSIFSLSLFFSWKQSRYPSGKSIMFLLALYLVQLIHPFPLHICTIVPPLSSITHVSFFIFRSVQCTVQPKHDVNFSLTQNIQSMTNLAAYCHFWVHSSVSAHSFTHIADSQQVGCNIIGRTPDPHWFRKDTPPCAKAMIISP